jgi:hypothetical protein
LQDASVAPHTAHSELLQHNVHFPSEAAYLARRFTSAAHYRWARQLHHQATTERHEVYPPAESTASRAASVLDIPLPSSANVVECAALEAKLSSLDAPFFTFNPLAPAFEAFFGAGHHLGDVETASSTVGGTLPSRHAKPLVTPLDYVDINYNSFMFDLGERDLFDSAQECLSAIISGAPSVLAIQCTIAHCQHRVSSLLDGRLEEHESCYHHSGMDVQVFYDHTADADEFGVALRALSRITATCSSIVGDLDTLISTLPQSVLDGASILQCFDISYDCECEAEDHLARGRGSANVPAQDLLVCSEAAQDCEHARGLLSQLTSFLNQLLDKFPRESQSMYLERLANPNSQHTDSLEDAAKLVNVLRAADRKLNDCWTQYCRNEGNGTRDPVRHSSSSLAMFADFSRDILIVCDLRHDATTVRLLAVVYRVMASIRSTSIAT